MKKIIDFAYERLGVRTISNDPNGVIVNEERINLNGIPDYETFYLPRHDPNIGFNFCKTARKPYDIVVGSILLLAHEHMPNSYDIGSDGEAREWKESMLLNAELLGYGFKLPPSFRSDPEKNQVEKEVIEFLAHEIIRNSNSSKKNKM